ncbi:MAG TPA: hypothetical protein VES94_01320 [Burkholderiales bacterium]|nr:hypothetical protein [Burkholderiales bacterium]
MALANVSMIKFGLKIRTRSGLPVDNLVVQARDQAEAERKITQMYMHCEILECRQIQTATRDDATDLDGIISLISRQGDEEKK